MNKYDMPIDKLQNLLEISKCSVGYLEASEAIPLNDNPNLQNGHRHLWPYNK